MIINRTNLTNLNVGYKAAFEQAFGEAPSEWRRIATYVRSTTAIETYAWLAQMPGMREWIGERVVKSIEAKGYQVQNRTFEDTIGVPREAIEDDQYGLYTPMMAALGASAGMFPDQLVFGQMGLGFTTNCHDGQFFFDTDHPVRTATGGSSSVSNVQAGSSTAWYLLDLSKPVKPLIYQERRRITWTAKDRLDDDNVFFNKEFVYGADGRMAAGFAFWQLAFGSKQTLSATNFDLAYDAMTAFKGDEGRPLGIKPTHLLIPPSLRKAADEIVTVARLANGADNANHRIVEIINSPWLT